MRSSRLIWWSLSVVAVWALPASAWQTNNDANAEQVEEDAPQSADSSAAKPAESTERPPRGRDAVTRVRHLHDLVRKEMKLRDEQSRAVNKLFERHLEALLEIDKQQQAKRRENAGRIKEIEQELAEARRERDRDAIRALHAEYRTLIGSDQKTMEKHRQFQQDVVGELDDEQAEQFRKLARQAMFERASGNRKFQQIQVLHRALRAVDLSEEQRAAVVKKFGGLRERLAQAREQGDEAVEKMLAELRESIISELNEGQIAQFEEAELRARQRVERRLRPGAAGPKRDPAGHGPADKTEASQPESNGGDEAPEANPEDA